MVSTAASSSSSLPSNSNSSNSTSEIVIPTVKTDELYYSVAILYNKDVKATFSVEYV